MEFRLFYRGTLKSNGDKNEKHKIRKIFHPQLKKLWEQPPLKDLENKLGGALNQLPIKEISFRPLVSQRLNMITELDILLLRPEPPGKIVTESGDIDNRLKTLFDALRIPKDGEIPEDCFGNNKTPFHCLLEDDALITCVSVTSDQLLDSADPKEVVLIIKVKTKVTRLSYNNTGLGD